MYSIGAVSVAMLAFSPVQPTVRPASRALSCKFAEQAFQKSIGGGPRCRIYAAESSDGGPSLSDQQIEAIFREFDTSGDGFIDLGELQAALAKAGKPVTMEQAQDILKTIDANDDQVISLEEFKSVFQLAPGAVPDVLKPLTGVSNFFLEGLGRVGEALGIEVRGQWRTTQNGARYVDDVVGSGDLIMPGDTVEIHFTVTLMDTGRVVQTSRRGPPLAYQVGEVGADGQSWDDSISGMRIGGQRRVYATPKEGDGPTARYDIEVVGIMEAVERSTSEKIITSLGGRRAVFRLLFAASFIPYFIPEKYQPSFFKDGMISSMLDEPDAAAKGEPKVDRADAYAKQQLDALFAQEELPKRKGSQK